MFAPQPIAPTTVQTATPVSPASLYIPEFDTTVTETWLISGQVFGVNSAWCLTMESAQALAALFSPAPEVYLDNPYPTVGPLRYNHQIPWFLFADGTKRNAAFVAVWWTYPGISGTRALAFARVDVEQG